MRWMELVGERPACKKGIEVPHPLELPEDDNSEEVKKFEENANKILQK